MAGKYMQVDRKHGFTDNWDKRCLFGGHNIYALPSDEQLLISISNILDIIFLSLETIKYFLSCCHARAIFLNNCCNACRVPYLRNSNVCTWRYVAYLLPPVLEHRQCGWATVAICHRIGKCHRVIIDKQIAFAVAILISGLTRPIYNWNIDSMYYTRIILRYLNCSLTRIMKTQVYIVNEYTCTWYEIKSSSCIEKDVIYLSVRKIFWVKSDLAILSRANIPGPRENPPRSQLWTTMSSSREPNHAKYGSQCEWI